MRIETKHCKLGGLLLLGLATMNASQWQPDTSQYAARSQATRQAHTQIVDQVEPLFRALFPDQDTLRFLVSPAPVYYESHRHHTLWVVDCVDAGSHVMAWMLWNASTKRALQFGPTLCHTSVNSFANTSMNISLRNKQGHSPLSFVDEKKAVAIARDWAARLRPVSGEALQKSEYEIMRDDRGWRVRLNLPDGMVMVWINIRSGGLQNAIVHDASASRPPIL